jgi:hypothetical protein
MSSIANRQSLAGSRPAAQPMQKGSVVVRWMTSTDHKIIGYL